MKNPTSASIGKPFVLTLKTLENHHYLLNVFLMYFILFHKINERNVVTDNKLMACLIFSGRDLFGPATALKDLKFLSPLLAEHAQCLHRSRIYTSVNGLSDSVFDS